MGDGTNIQGILNPLFKVALPRNVEEVARNPEEDDCQVTEVGSKNLLVKILFRHAIVQFKIVGRGNPVPDPTSSGILSQILAKFREFSCHKFVSPLSNRDNTCKEEGPSGHNSP